jgi:hypothetical protein
MPLSTDLREFIECLNSNKVDYLVVGALAVSWHGFPRYSADIDFLIRPSHANAERVLRRFLNSDSAASISASDLTLTGKVIQLGYEPNRIDLMTSVTGVSFDDAWDDRAAGDLDGVPVNFIGRSSLLRNKDATGRAKDRIDAEELRKQKPST